MKEISIVADTTKDVALAVARHTERGNSDRTPRWMHTRYRALIKLGKSSQSADWDAPFRADRPERQLFGKRRRQDSRDASGRMNG